MSDRPSAGHRLIARNFLALGTGEIVSRVIGFLSTIYVARQLGNDAYGVIGFAFAVTMYAAAVTDFGLEQHGPREVPLHRESPGTLIASVGAGRILIGLVLAILMAGTGWVAPEPDGRVLILFGLTLLPAGAGMRWLHVGTQRSGVASVARVTGEALRLAILLYVVRDASDIYFVPLAQVAGDTVAAVVMLAAIRARERVGLRIDPGLAVAVLRRAAPLLLANLLGYVIYNSDVILLRVMRPVSEVGLYLAAYALINLLGVLGNSIAVSLIPGLAEPSRSRSGRQSVIDAATAHVLALALPLAAGGSILGKPLIALAFGADYDGAGPVLGILIWTFPLLLVRSVQLAALIAEDRRGDVLRITGWSAALSVSLNLVAIPLFGMVGAAGTTVGTEIVRMGLAIGHARRAGYRGPRALRFWRIGLASAIMGVVVTLLAGLPVLALVPVGALVYLVALGLLGGVKRRNEGGFRLNV